MYTVSGCHVRCIVFAVSTNMMYNVYCIRLSCTVYCICCNYQHDVQCILYQVIMYGVLYLLASWVVWITPKASFNQRDLSLHCLSMLGGSYLTFLLL